MGVLDILGRISVLLATAATFIPQGLAITSEWSADGISLTYLLLNLIMATEEFAMGSYYMLNNKYLEESIVDSPPTAEDWLNLCQHAVFWTGTFTTFFVALSCPPDRKRLKRLLLAIYAFCFIISLGWTAVLAFISVSAHTPEQRATFLAELDRFGGVHIQILNPLATVAGLFAMVFQVNLTNKLGRTGSLDAIGLFFQVPIFVLGACYWKFRMTANLGVPMSMVFPGLEMFVKWYWKVGWAAVDHMIFAVVQAVVMVVAMRTLRQDMQHAEPRSETDRAADETAPLL